MVTAIIQESLPRFVRQTYIEDGTFWKCTEDIITTYFNDTIYPAKAKNMIKYAYSELFE